MCTLFMRQGSTGILAMQLLLFAEGGEDKEMRFHQVESGQRIRELRRMRKIDGVSLDF